MQGIGIISSPDSLRQEKGEAGLIYAVHNIPANITPSELASAFNDTLERLCGDSREVQFSSTSLSSDSPYPKDLLDFEYEKNPPAPSLPQTTAHSELPLPQLSDFFITAESGSTSQGSINDLLFRHGLDELLLPPLVPTPGQTPTVKAADPSLCPKESPLDTLNFLGSLSFDGLNPYPQFTKARAVINRAIVESRAGAFATADKKAILRKQAGTDLRKASTNSPLKPSLLELSSAKPDPFLETKTLVEPRQIPQSLRPGPLNIRRALLPRSTPRPLPIKIYMPSRVAHSPYVAYNPDRAPILPVPTTASKTLMEEITNELEKVLVAFDATSENEGEPDEATSQAQGPKPLPTRVRPIIPPRTSSRPARNVSETITKRSLSFKDRLLDASRSAILAAASEAETSDLRWFHCRT